MRDGRAVGLAGIVFSGAIVSFSIVSPSAHPAAIGSGPAAQRVALGFLSPDWSGDRSDKA